jgi:hypothetical protein
MELIELNLRALDQARVVLASIDDAVYTEPAPRTNGIRIGAHLRHAIEFYECFLDGYRSRCLDYDARRRDAAVEQSRAAALRAIDRVEHSLRTVCDGPVVVRAGDLLLPSSIVRELQALFEHTIHHFALIAVALHAFGVGVEGAFGVAPSTLRYRAQAA